MSAAGVAQARGARRRAIALSADTQARPAFTIVTEAAA